MKKRIPILALVLAILMLGSGCAAQSAADTAPMDNGIINDSYHYSSTETFSDDAMAEIDMSTANTVTGSGLTASQIESPNASTLSEKIIYTGSARVETTDFDATVEAVYRLVADFGGFLEGSSVSGQDYRDSYYGNHSFRTAEFTIRVPKDNFASLQDALSTLGYVTHVETWTENITARYLDTESRLSAFRTEETSLMELLARAETVDEMIQVQSRLSEVRYEIESLTSTLRYYQTQVDYSTLTLSLQEVTKIVETPSVPVTYWDEIVAAFTDGIDLVVDTLGWLGTTLVTLIPVLFLPAILTVVIVLLVRRRNARRYAAWLQQQQPPTQDQP